MSEDGLLLPCGLERGGSCRVSPAGSRHTSPRPSLTHTPSPNRSPRPSLTPGSPNRSPRPSLTPQPPTPPSPTEPPTSYRVAIIGARGVGKSSLVSQFLTSESINAYDRPNGEKIDTRFHFYYYFRNYYIRYKKILHHHRWVNHDRFLYFTTTNNTCKKRHYFLLFCNEIGNILCESLLTYATASISRLIMKISYIIMFSQKKNPYNLSKQVL